MVTACVLLAVYLTITLVAPRLLSSRRLLVRRPAVLMRLWLSALALASLSLLIAIGITLLGTPNAIVNRVLLVQQRPYMANSWQLIGQLAALGGMLICTHASKSWC